MTVDYRAKNMAKITPPAPLPHVSRRALSRIDHPVAIPTACRYCASPVDLVENSAIYNGRTYGDWPYAYLCCGCGAYVGLHPDTDLPLGTLADRYTRDTRNICKRAFEQIWRHQYMTRSQAYAWLAAKMGISVADCHFGLFEPAQCKVAQSICLNYLNDPRANAGVSLGKLEALVRRFA